MVYLERRIKHFHLSHHTAQVAHLVSHIFLVILKIFQKLLEILFISLKKTTSGLISLASLAVITEIVSPDIVPVLILPRVNPAHPSWEGLEWVVISYWLRDGGPGVGGWFHKTSWATKVSALLYCLGKSSMKLQSIFFAPASNI